MMNTRSRTKLAEALPEVSYTDDDHRDVHKANVGDDREDVKNNLLRQVQVFHVNRVEARLGATAASEEEGIDGLQVAEAYQYDECYKRATDDIAICTSC
jgi:hypothetical protein